jgi:hypothetical protein
MPQQFGSYGMAHFRPPTEAVMQQSIEGHEGGCTSSIGKKQVKVKQSNFSADEDVHLTKWWVVVSTDPVINTGQRREGSGAGSRMATTLIEGHTLSGL